MNPKIAFAIFLVALALAPRPGQSAQRQSHESIIQAASDYLRAKLEAAGAEGAEIRPGRLDPRLRMSACGQPLEAFLPAGSRQMGNVTVGVRCPGPKRWTLYVPMRIDLYTEVVVARQALPKGRTLSAGQLTLARRNLAELPQGYFHDLAEVEGMVLKRNLAAGQALTPALLKRQRLVERGQEVTLLAGSGGLQVQVPGEALSHGAKGQRIRVRNRSSKRIVEGVVIGKGLVQVKL